MILVVHQEPADNALKNPVGVHLARSDSDVITVSDDAGGRGTSKAYALRRLRANAEALDLLDQALQNPARRPRSTDVIRTSDDAGGHGTAKAYALRRLRANAPELHADVLAGRLSAHAGNPAA